MTINTSSEGDIDGGGPEWVSLVSAIWLQSVIGTNANFPAYSSQLKHYLSLSQLHLNSLAFASDAGKLFGWVAGYVARRVPLWLILIIGSTLGFLSYGLQFLTLDSHVADAHSSPSSFVIFFVLNTLAGHSICWFNTFCYNVVVQSFPFHGQQVAVGLATSYQALTSKIYAVVVGEVVFISSAENKVKSYLLLQSLLPLIVSAVALSLLVIVKLFNNTSNTNRKAARTTKLRRFRFVVMFLITTATGVYAVFSSLCPKLWRMFPYSGVVFTSGLLLMPMAIPIGVLIRAAAAAESGVLGVEEGGGGKEAAAEEEDVVVGVVFKEEIGVKAMVQRAEFWLHVLVYFFGPTIGMVYLSNLGQISESRMCYETSALVSLCSSFTFFGRLLPSFFDYFFSRCKCLASRPAFLVLLMTPISASFFLLALNNAHTALYISTATIGVCSGAIISLAVSISSELFGPKHFGVNHNIVVANIPIGSLVFGYLAARVYQTQKQLAGQSKCMGMECYRRTFVIWGQLSGFGVLLAVVLYFRTREFYAKRSVAINKNNVFGF